MEQLTIKEIRAKTGLSQEKFGEMYHIPRNTIRNWELNIRKCPVYVLELLDKAVSMDFAENT